MLLVYKTNNCLNMLSTVLVFYVSLMLTSIQALRFVAVNRFDNLANKRATLSYCPQDYLKQFEQKGKKWQCLHPHDCVPNLNIHMHKPENLRHPVLCLKIAKKLQKCRIPLKSYSWGKFNETF